jgi:hypothetical protein
MKTLLRVWITIVIAAGLLAPQAAVFAQDDVPGCGEELSGIGCAPAEDGVINAQASAGFKLAYSKTLKGGYVAHGVGMRNAGSGTIQVSDVPAGAKVVKAYLFWAVTGPKTVPGFYYNKGKINNSSVTGSLIGSSAYTDPIALNSAPFPMWAYRADVTGKMIRGGNGTYVLSGFASGLTNGEDPWEATSAIVPPLFDGATLVIVFSKTDYPSTTVKIYNGAAATGPGTSESLHLAMTGMNATGPTGLTKATFIGGDGQPNLIDEETSFFDAYLPEVAWDGLSVPNSNGVDFGGGNLWDTQTVDLTYMVEAPESDFWFTIRGGDDRAVWVAQVASYANGSQDTDGDKLSDAWELHGVQTATDRLDLHHYGADPLHKDLFIEADYLTTADPAHDHLLTKAKLDDIVNTFDEAPVTNPDGTTGINIHIDTGGATYGTTDRTTQYDLGGGNAIPETVSEYQIIGSQWVRVVNGNDFLGDIVDWDYDWSEFQTIKNENFDPSRAGIFHYMIFGHEVMDYLDFINYDPYLKRGTSGISRNGSLDKTFVKGATDFIVSMGYWDDEDVPGIDMGTQEQREGTFVHELGHNLGLRHGGNDHVNYKPNYLSVMNYFYQMLGVYRDGEWRYDYSRIAPTISETSLKEPAGLGSTANGYGVMWFCPQFGEILYQPTNTLVDWNCNKHLDGTVRADVNWDGRLTSLKSQNNWASITFAGGGTIGTLPTVSGLAANVLMTTRPSGCLTFEDAQRIEAESITTVP